MCRRRDPPSVDASKKGGTEMDAIYIQELPHPSERVLDTLLEEIRRYLEAVDVFRAEGSGPRWPIDGTEGGRQ